MLSPYFILVPCVITDPVHMSIVMIKFLVLTCALMLGKFMCLIYYEIIV